jgi:hypothetical protein
MGQGQNKQLLQEISRLLTKNYIRPVCGDNVIHIEGQDINLRR